MTIRRLFAKRPDLFPAYSPSTEVSLEQFFREVTRWGRRILILVGVMGILGTAASYSGWKYFGPSAQFDSLRSAIAGVRLTTTNDIAAVRDTATATSKRVDSVERDVRTNLYLTCELLRRSQPRAIPPHECSDEAQQARRTP